MNFYNAYRPKLFNEVVGQSQATEILKRQILSGDVSHSLLFYGPSGTGKTTTARILAAVLNCENPVNGEPCNNCHSCQMALTGTHWDITELDAARYRGIDDVKELCYSAYLSPFCRRKIYILDECHQFTEPAQSALLKLIEEPPPHLIIIMCTSAHILVKRKDSQGNEREICLVDDTKILPTLSSRCQQFAFTKLDPECIKVKLSRICQSIGVTPDSRHLDFIAQSAGGNCRTAENTLQQVCALAVK
jgi:DNA polymerase-3 subunit gamma/tau